jgi:hypothetical protein
VTARTLAALVTAAVAAPALLGCARKAKDDPCGDSHAPIFELRDGQGVLKAALRSGGAGAAPSLCDEAGRWLGALGQAPVGRGLSLRGPAAEVLITAGSTVTDDATLEVVEGGCAPAREPGAGSVPRCRRLRLHRGGDLLRVLDDAGVPLGQIDGKQGGAAVYDGGGRPLFTCGRVEAQDPGRLAIRATDGATRFLVFGLNDERAAAALALPSLSLSERVVLARFLAAR